MGVDWGGGAGGIIKRVKGSIRVEGGSPSFTVVTIVGFKRWSLSCLSLSILNVSMLHILHSKKPRSFSTTSVNSDATVLLTTSVVQVLSVKPCYSKQVLPDSVIFPCQYVRASSKNICVYQPPMNGGSRFFYSLDKARSLALLCQIIKAEKGIKIPRL
jgi:hypothetical protein